MEELIGRKAYPQRGFFAGIVGIIEKSDGGLFDYELVFKDGSGYAFGDMCNITLLEEEGDV